MASLLNFVAFAGFPMKKWLAVLLGFASILDAVTWKLNQTVLEERLPDGITPAELIRILESEGVEVLLEKEPDLELWKSGPISISLAKAPFAPYHLWVSVAGRKSLDECTEEEFAGLYEAIWKGRKALEEAAGANGFLIFTAGRNESDSSDFVRVEIVPAPEGNPEVMDAVEKNALVDYAFLNRHSLRDGEQKGEQKPQTIAAIREILRTLKISQQVQPESVQGKWSQKILRHREACHQSLQSIHDDLAQLGILIEGEMPALPEAEKSVHEMHIDLDVCSFCNPRVIEKQIVCDWKGVQILMSHKPNSPYGNFLILPKRHQTAWDLTREEAIASFESVVALKKMFLKTVGSNDWICYIQDGPSIGQTVPHTHIHFFLVPDPMKIAITVLQHIRNQRRVLTYEEMRSGCEKAKPLVLENLNKSK